MNFFLACFLLIFIIKIKEKKEVENKKRSSIVKAKGSEIVHSRGKKKISKI